MLFVVKFRQGTFQSGPKTPSKVLTRKGSTGKWEKGGIVKDATLEKERT